MSSVKATKCLAQSKRLSYPSLEQHAATYYQLYDAEVEVCLFSKCLQLTVYFHKDIRIWRHMTIALTQSSISIPPFFPPYQLLLRFCY